MSEFTADELFEAVDRLVAELLTRHGVDAPPVDAVALARDAFQLSVREAEPEDEPEVELDEPEAGRAVDDYSEDPEDHFAADDDATSGGTRGGNSETAD